MGLKESSLSIASHLLKHGVCNQKMYPCADSGKEQAAMLNNTLINWTTGGGFSFFSSRPSYQTSAVEAYLLKGNIIKPPKKFYNESNRGYPDISAVGSRLLYVK